MAGLNEEIREIKELLKSKDERKEKNFKLPWNAKVNPSRAKNNWVTLMKINENGHVNFKKVQITEQTIIEESIPRLATAGYVTYYKKNPLIILPSWSVEPFSPMEHYQKSLIDGSNTKGYQILMNRMKLSQLGDKKQLGGMVKWIIGGALALIIGYAFLTG